LSCLRKASEDGGGRRKKGLASSRAGGDRKRRNKERNKRIKRNAPAAENTGSSVLIVCVNDTATAANDTFVRQCPNACRKLGNVTSFMNSESGVSNFTSLVVQKNVMMSKPTARCTAETNHGYGK